ncbi:MAG: VC0807 family protein [Lacunisphaera sp.]
MPPAKPKPENLWLNLTFNVALPTAIQSWGSGDKGFGPKWGLIIALLFPLAYGVYDFVVRRRFNFISILGFASVLITGGFGLLKLDVFWFAVKDGILPLLIGAAIFASIRTKAPLVKEMLYNPQIIDIDRVDRALTERGEQKGFERLLSNASYLLTVAMLLSAVLNYSFARYIIRSPSGTEAFNQELAKMHWISLAGLSLPVMGMMMYALWRLLGGLERITGLTMDEILRQPVEKKTVPAAATASDPSPPTSGSA